MTNETKSGCKCIYVMAASRQALDEKQRGDAILQGLQVLADKDTNFTIHWNRVKSSRPPVREGAQKLNFFGSSFEKMESEFKNWLREDGVTLDEGSWDTYRFSHKTPGPASHVFVYYDMDLDASEIQERYDFMVTYTLAGQKSDSATLARILKGKVRCDECDKLIDPALRAQNEKGHLECPFCGEWWTKSASAA